MSAGLPLDPYAASRWLGYVGLFGLIGATVFRAIARRIPDNPASDLPVSARVTTSTRNAATAAAVALMISIILRLYFQVRSGLDPGDPMDRGAIAAWFSGPGSWGEMWVVQLLAGCVALSGLVIGRRYAAVGACVMAAGTLGAVASMPLTGHAIESRLGAPAGVALQAVHILGGGVWLGTLIVLLYATLRATEAGSAERGRVVALAVHAYSPVALTGAGIAIVAGVALAWLNVGSLGALWGTDYGRALLVKLSLLLGVAGLGAYNWLRVRPALGSAAGTARLRRSATLELCIGAALLAVTAVLVVLASPRL